MTRRLPLFTLATFALLQPAVAGWEFNEVKSAFAPAVPMAAIQDDDSVFAMRCTNATGEAHFVAQGFGALLPPNLNLVGAKVFGAVKAGDADPIQNPATLRLMGEDLVVTFPISPSQIEEIGNSDGPVAVGLTTATGVVVESEYGTEGVAEAVRALLSRCRVP